MGEYFILELPSFFEWNRYLKRLPLEQQDIYFTSEYYRLYEELGDGKAKCFVFEKGKDIAIYPFLMNSVNDLGYKLDNNYYDIQGAYGYNGVVASTYEEQFVKFFYLAFNEYCKNENIIAEFTRFNPILKNHLFSKEYLSVTFDRMIVYLDLNQDYEKIFSNFQTTTRKQIKRSTKKYNLEVKIFEKALYILDDFYHIYHEAMVRVKSIPYLFFNRSYFKSLMEDTQNVCLIAYHEKKPIASIIVFYNGYYINGHLGGALSEYMNMSPFSFLYSEMIKYGQQKGCRYLNVGGGATINPDDPLLKFKKNFSKTTIDFFIGKKIYNQPIYDEIINQWGYKFPEKVKIYNNLLLKYRY